MPDPSTNREPILTIAAPLSAWKRVADIWYGQSPAGGDYRIHRAAEGLMLDIDDAVSRADGK